MRKILSIAIVAIVIFNIVYAQQKPADSLLSLLRTHSQNDTVRVDLINALTKEYRRSKPKVADSLINVALDLSNQLNYKRGRGNALTNKANR